MHLKTIILTFFLILRFCSFGQNFNYIDYKKECDVAYRLALDDEKYKETLQTLYIIHLKYKKLFRDEYILKAYCYKKLGDNEKSADAIYTAWSTYSFDINCINQIEELDCETISKGFTRKQMEHVNKGYRNSSNLTTTLCDSIIKTFQILEKLDHRCREKLELHPADSVKIKKEIRATDSINHVIFKKIIKDYGYPGEKLIPNNTGYAFLILTHSANYQSFYDEMQPVLYNEVKNGRMPPSHYVFWLDRYHEAHKIPLKYGILDVPSQQNLSVSEKKAIQQERLENGLIKHYPIPSIQINSK